MPKTVQGTVLLALDPILAQRLPFSFVLSHGSPVLEFSFVTDTFNGGFVIKDGREGPNLRVSDSCEL